MVTACLTHQQGVDYGIYAIGVCEGSPSGEYIPPTDLGRPDAIPISCEDVW